MKARTLVCGAVFILPLLAIAGSVQAQTLTPQQTLDQARIAEQQREAQSDNVNPEGSCPKVVVTVPPAGFTRSPGSTSFLAEEKLKHCVADLQKTPGDTALREKIIALSLMLIRPPEVPADAKRHMSRGVAAVEDAKTPEDFKDACKEFLQATTIAPWLGNAYRNLAIAQDKAGMYNESLASLRLYLLTKPPAVDADWAEDLKSKVEYRRDKAARQSSPQAIAARQQNVNEEWLKKIDGARYVCNYADNRDVGFWSIDVHGSVVTKGMNITWSRFNPVGSRAWGSGTLQGRQISIAQQSWCNGGVNCPEICTISDDGNTLSCEYQDTWPGGAHEKKTQVYRRQR